MRYDDTTDHLILADGTTYYAYSGVLGIAPRYADESTGEAASLDMIWYGSDGGLEARNTEERCVLPPGHRVEIAHAMILAWQHFLARAEADMAKGDAR